MTTKKSILLIANNARTMINFRWSFLQELLKCGYQPIVSVPYDEKSFAKLQELNIELVPLQISRKGLNPFAEIICLWNIYRIIKYYKPNLCMFYTIKPDIYGSIAARVVGVRHFSMITGLGYVFTGDSPIHKILQFFIKKIYRFALKNDSKIFFLNHDDRDYFLDNKIITERNIQLINGEGVDTEYFSFSPLTINRPATFLFLARLLKDKGVYEFVNAAKIIKQKYPNTELLIAGDIDDNPSSIGRDELDIWIKEKVINYLGYLSDVREVIKNSSVFVLPSYYREGLPVSILEAMAIGRAIITTDAPGCRDTVVDGENGYLVPIKNIDKLAEAMEKFIINPNLISQMGLKSRYIVEEKFDVRKINAVILNTILQN